jgi:hypothetical protein
MTETPATTIELTHELTDLEGAEPTPETSDGQFRDDVDKLVARWRGWIDEVKVRADLGRKDSKDELQKLVTRLDNAWRTLKNEVARTGEDADVSLDDLRRDARVLFDDLRRAGRATVARLQADH